MATTSGGHLDAETLGQSAPLAAGIGVCTVALTAAFVGVVALASGQATGALSRLPAYVLASSVAFLVVLLTVDDRHRDGTVVLAQASAAGLGEFVLVTLATEGVVYALTRPGAVVASHLFVYLLSAAVIASGLGFWGVRHWRDVRGYVTDGRRSVGGDRL